MMNKTLRDIISAHSLRQARLARACGISETSMSQLINHGDLPRRNTADILARLADALEAGGSDAADVRAALEGLTTNALPDEKPKKENDIMLFKKQAFTPEAKRIFGIFHTPFDEPQKPEQVFLTPQSRYAREALYDAAVNGNFLALVGQSGSGKTTLFREMETRIGEEHQEVIFIKPYILTMSPEDRGAGKPLRISHILEAIIATVEPEARTNGSPEALARRAHEVLTRSAKTGNRHVVVIEEAHDLHVQTLKGLKRLWEMRDGLKRLLSIILIGQTELGERLTSTSADVREVVQRCDVVTLPPLPDIGEFIRHRFTCAGLDADSIFTPDAYDALRQRTIMGRDVKGRGDDMAYPLAISNLATACVNFAAAGGLRQVDADVVRTVQV